MIEFNNGNKSVIIDLQNKNIFCDLKN